MFEIVTKFWPLLVIALMLLAGVQLARLLSGRQRMPYIRRPRLVTQAELRFFHELRQAVAGDWEIFAMVRIADLIRVESGSPQYRAWLNKITSKHIDFVVCDNDTLAVLLGIELDDPSHAKPARIERDQFVNNVFADAGLPLLRIETQKSYDVPRLRSLIDNALKS